LPFPDGVVYYIIRVTGLHDRWSIRKRYTQLENLHIDFIQLFIDYADDLPQLPPKKIKLFQSHTAPAFIEARKVLIENYLRKVLDNPKLARSKLAHDFFTSDKYNEVPPHSNIPWRDRSGRSNSLPDRQTLSVPSASSSSSSSSSKSLRSSSVSSSSTSSSTSGGDVFEVSSVSIPSTRTVNNKVLYVIECTSIHKPVPMNTWTVMKRFAQFSAMDATMRAGLYPNEHNAEMKKRILDALPSVPSKQSKYFTDHLDPNFVEERRVLLEHYLRKLIAEPECNRQPALLDFLGCES